MKRKAPGSSALTKRVAREKTFASSPPFPTRNSCTKQPLLELSPPSCPKPPSSPPQSDSSLIPKLPDSSLIAHFEAIKNRQSHVHVVPNAAGWFSWTKIHALEERLMPSFFNGKSEARTPNIYMEVRNRVMKKFHANPLVNAEVQDLPELCLEHPEVGLEIMEFLSNWGLINFHPFPPANSSKSTDVSTKITDLIDKLYQFELVEFCTSGASDQTVSESAKIPHLFPDCSVFDEMSMSRGPSVEYHCNSCSADCSHKRYHCRTQADFDLCLQCYKDEKFGSGMNMADFILMEPAEAPGTSCGNWTDQETLLLLEALELYGDNWNEIAEHVATKTKVRCMLHFMQMPIEDSFLEVERNTDAYQGILDSEAKGLTTSGNVLEAEKGSFAASHSQSLESLVHENKLNDIGEFVSLTESCSSSLVHNILRIAFHSTGSLPGEQELPSFKELSNSVMALAAFLVGLVDDTVVAASAYDSLKAIRECASSAQLTARHCYVLDDPPTIIHPILGSGKEISASDKNTPCDGIDNDTFNPEPAKESDSILNTGQVGCGISLMETQGGPVSVKVQEEIKRDETQDKHLHDMHLEGLPDTTKKELDSSMQFRVSASQSGGTNDLFNSTVLAECITAADVVKDSSGSIPDDVNPSSDAVSNVVVVSEAMKEGPQQTVDPDSIIGASVLQTNQITADSVKETTETGYEMLGASRESEDEHVCRLRSAALSALSAASVKAKLLADREENEIRELALWLIQNQLRKLEVKVSLFGDMESVLIFIRGQLELAKQKLYHERAQIIAARLGLTASFTRPATLQSLNKTPHCV